MSVAGHQVLVTGAAGSVGSALVPALRKAGAGIWGTDIEELDVRDAGQVAHMFETLAPTLVFHLAALKLAPAGELDPAAFAETNIGGTANILEAAAESGARVVFASSCKAADPETAYGASKLIAERMVLNAGGSVARFFNVRESSGDVFERWRGLPDDEPIPVTPCTRYFISLDQAVELLLAVAGLPAGRYCVDPGKSRWMPDVAHEVYPGRAQRHIEPRRGDRLHEPLHAVHERIFGSGILRIESRHDPAADECICGEINARHCPVHQEAPDRGSRRSADLATVRAMP